MLTIPTVDTTAHHPARPKMRPQSRASTTSVHSATTQPNLDHASFADMSSMYAGQWQDHHHAHHAEMQSSQQGQPIGPEDMLVQAIPHMQGPAGDYSMTDSMGAPMGHHHLPFNPHQAQHHPGPHVNWGHDDSRMMGHDDLSASQTPVDAGGVKPAAGKSSKKKSNANNDGEMRDLFQGNRSRPLDEVAKDLRGNERGPQAERKRQLYAMLW